MSRFLDKAFPELEEERRRLKHQQMMSEWTMPTLSPTRTQTPPSTSPLMPTVRPSSPEAPSEGSPTNPVIFKRYMYHK